MIDYANRHDIELAVVVNPSFRSAKVNGAVVRKGSLAQFDG